MIEPGDVDQEPFTPGWVPDGWEKGEPFRITRFADQFQIENREMIRFKFDNWRLPYFQEWLEWWNDE